MAPGVTSDVAAQLRGVAAMLRVEDKDLKRALNLETRRTLLPYAKSRISGATRNHLQARTARTATMQTGRGFPYLKLAGKVHGVNLAAAAEFGSVGQVRVRYTIHSRAGKPYTVTRRTTAQFRPPNKGGKFIYPTVETMTGAASAAWLQVVSDLYAKRLNHGP